MEKRNFSSALILGIFFCIGMALFGILLSNGFIEAKSLERTVTVKGLSEREVPANVAIWPISFNEADNDLNSLFLTIQRKSAKIRGFLLENGFTGSEISTSPPSITDKQAQNFGNSSNAPFRYTGRATVTVYSSNVEKVRSAMDKVIELGKAGIAITGEDYQSRPEFLFTELNSIKPEMIEEATRNAREVANKFARDSASSLGKIKQARQGQFSIGDRDSNTPHIKRVRVVSTVIYYLSD